MEFLELKNISERYLELLNPTTPEKLLMAGQVAGMQKGSRVIDYGCGYAAELILWAKAFGISGVGIDIRPAACERARAKIKEEGLIGQLEIACGNASEYPVEPHSYDFAACIGATFCWPGDFQEAVRAMRQAVKPDGRLIVGEVHWLTSDVPPEIRQPNSFCSSESELLKKARDERLEIIYVLHSNHDDWDHYVSENWRGLSDWLDENPSHPERESVLQHLHQGQEEYLHHEREYFGWALYVLKPTP